MERREERRDRLKREELESKEHRAEHVRAVRSIRSDITHSGFMPVMYKMEYYKQNPDIPIPFNLSREEWIECFQEAIDKHLNKKK